MSDFNFSFDDGEFSFDFGEAHRYTNAMIDLETLSVRPNPVILSIGVVLFDVNTLTMGPTFYSSISAASGQALGLHVDPGTQHWWDKQAPEARAAAFSGTEDVRSVLARLRVFMSDNMVPLQSRCVWGKGANADPIWLEESYRAIGEVPPWAYYGVRCFRTFRKLWPDVEADETAGVHHNALDDAIWQVTHMFKIIRTLRGSK